MTAGRKKSIQEKGNCETVEELEMEVIRLANTGTKRKDIAQKFGISKDSVRRIIEVENTKKNPEKNYFTSRKKLIDTLNSLWKIRV